MLALIFGVLFAVSFLGFAITSRTKYSAASHLFWGVAFIIFTVCFTCAFCYTIGTSDLLVLELVVLQITNEKWADRIHFVQFNSEYGAKENIIKMERKI